MKTFLIVILAALSALLWWKYQTTSSELMTAKAALQTTQEQLQKSEQLRQQAVAQLQSGNPSAAEAQPGVKPRVVRTPLWFQEQLDQDKARAHALSSPH